MKNRQPSLFAFDPGTAFSDDEKASILADHQQAACAAWKSLEALFAYIAGVSWGRSVSGDLEHIRATPPDEPQTQMAYWLGYIQHHPVIGFTGYLSLKLHSPGSQFADEKGAYLYLKAQTLLTVAHLVAHGEIDAARHTLGL